MFAPILPRPIIPICIVNSLLSEQIVYESNPKSEARKPVLSDVEGSETNETVKSEIQKSESGNELVWNFLLFYHLNLFRISDFEFRIFSHLLSFAAARRRSMAAATPPLSPKIADPATSTLAP